MRTFFDLLKRTSNLKWSTNDPEPKNFDEVLMSSKVEMQRALVELWNEYPYPFKSCSEFRIIDPMQVTIQPPMGQLSSIKLEDGTELQKISSDTKFDDKKGIPTCYKIETSNYGAKVTLYPCPHIKLTIGFYYQSMLMAKDIEGTLKVNLEKSDDTLAIEHLVYIELFENALVLLTQCNLIEDEQDENFVPYKQAYQKALSILKNYTSSKEEKRIIM